MEATVIHDNHYFSDIVKNIIEESKAIGSNLKNNLEKDDSYTEYVSETSMRLLDECINLSNKDGISFLHAESIIVEKYKINLMK